MAELRFDEEATKRLLALYVTPDMVSQRGDFLRALDPRPGERVLDVSSAQDSWRARSQRPWNREARSMA